MGVVGNLETSVVSLLLQELDTESHVQAVMPKSEGLIKCTRLTTAYTCPTKDEINDGIMI